MGGWGRQGAFSKDTGRALIMVNTQEASLNEDKKTNVDANSREFERGVAAGLNSEDTKYWQAGYALGQELGDRETKEPVTETIASESDSPLFLRDTLDGHDGDAQDEKDKSAE
jgi:hypothetical protein